MNTPSDPIRCCLALNLWSKADQELWHKITVPRHVLDEDGDHSATWREPTREKNRKGYGRWLSYLIVHHGVERIEAPTDRITRERVKDYVLMLQDQISPWTVWSYVLCLHQVALAFAPEKNWSWLYKITAKLKIRRIATRNKLARMRSATEICTWAYQRLDDLNENPDRHPSTVIKYRDALFVGILINCPMRLRNLAMIRIGKHLQWTGEVYRLDFAPDEVKTNRYLTLYLPSILNGYLDAWINDWRPHLLKDPSLDDLWISIRGEPMLKGGVYLRVISNTEAAFGVAINPHLFRDIAVTSIADEIPKNIGITALLLGHINPKTTEDHYIHANQLLAGRRYASSVATLRESLTLEYQGPYKLEGDR